MLWQSLQESHRSYLELPAQWPPCGCVGQAADGHIGPTSARAPRGTPPPLQVEALQLVTQTGMPLLQSRREPRSWAMRTTASLHMQPGTTPTRYMMWSAIRCLSSSGQTRGPALQRQAPCIDACVKCTVSAPLCRGKRDCPLRPLHRRLCEVHSLGPALQRQARLPSPPPALLCEACKLKTGEWSPAVLATGHSALPRGLKVCQYSTSCEMALITALTSQGVFLQ